jgi:hypothetical protein
MERRLAAMFFLDPLSWFRGRDVVEDDEVEDGPWDVDERVCLIRPSHERGALEEPPLYGRLDEDAEALLDVDELEGMFPGCVDGGCLQCHGGEGAPELVNLLGMSMR